MDYCDINGCEDCKFWRECVKRRTKNVKRMNQMKLNTAIHNHGSHTLFFDIFHFFVLFLRKKCKKMHERKTNNNIVVIAPTKCFSSNHFLRGYGETSQDIQSYSTLEEDLSDWDDDDKHYGEDDAEHDEHDWSNVDEHIPNAKCAYKNHKTTPNDLSSKNDTTYPP
eukprot:181265_1